MRDAKAAKGSASVFVLFAGILLPIAALAFEGVTGIMRAMYLDPLPSLLHYVLIGTVPLANCLLLLAMQRGVLPGRAASWLLAFAIGVSAVYTVLFLPTVPIAPFAILLFGLGFLLLAPMLSLIAALIGRRYLKRTASYAPVPFWAGLALALSIMLAFDAPAALTHTGMQMAQTHSPEVQLRAVRFLRAVGSEDILLRYCHPRSQRNGGIVGALLDLRGSVSPGEARTLFFRVTGESFSSRPVPPERGRFDRDNPLDFDVGGDKVGQHVDAIELASSRIDGSLDALAALGYLEWTMSLRNGADNQQEGRMELMLPPGAVVSRATLWINGEEHEAAFGGKSQVREAYQRVVQAKRDPLLVTTAGNGRVLVQMFPIPPHGEMKIRIGITTPLQLADLQRASMQLPLISERNFEIGPALRHAVWIESATPLTDTAPLRAQQVKPGLFALRGDVAHLAPGADLPLVEARRAQPNLVAWSRDDKGSKKDMIVQTISEQPAVPPRRIAVVIDGSSSLAPYKHKLRDALDALPSSANVRVMFAGDGVPAWHDHLSSDISATRDFINALAFVGGRDNAPALSDAWDWTSAEEKAAIIWIHGPQPEPGTTVDTLLQTISRRAAPTALYDVQLAQGVNDITSRIAGPGLVEAVHSSATGVAGLQPLFDSWRLQARHFVIERERGPLRAMTNEALTSVHLTRLWAAQRVEQLAADPARRDEAIAMATTYQLVTPVSGAVVLESQAAFDNAGLQPVAPGSVPTIPEPETWAMLAVALLILGVHGYRRRRA